MLTTYLYPQREAQKLREEVIRGVIRKYAVRESPLRSTPTASVE